MEVISTIFEIILGIGCFIGLAYAWGLFQDWLAKTTNSNISYRGKIVSRPHYHNQNINEIKEFKSKVVGYIQKVKFQKNDLDISEQIKLLKQLDELKINRSISEEEYLELKEKILKKK
jgi:hypothetical protein